MGHRLEVDRRVPARAGDSGDQKLRRARECAARHSAGQRKGSGVRKQAIAVSRRLFSNYQGSIFPVEKLVILPPAFSTVMPSMIFTSLPTSTSTGLDIGIFETPGLLATSTGSTSATTTPLPFRAWCSL